MGSGTFHADRLRELRGRCDELDRLIAELSKGAVSDFSKIRRLREEKRAALEQITALERTPPDIIA